MGFLILLTGFSVYIATPAEATSIRVDGRFEDWARIPFAVDGPYRTHNTQVRQYFQFSTPTTGARDRMDAFRVWFDVDRNPNTGLLVDGIGADFRLLLQFWQGAVKSASLCRWRESADPWAYTEFSGCRSIAAASGPGQIEFVLLRWWIGPTSIWVAESIPVLGARTVIRHGNAEVPWKEPAASSVWRDYVQVSGNADEWQWLGAENLTETFPSNVSVPGRLDIGRVTARLTAWNTSLLLQVRADPLPIPFFFSPPPREEPPSDAPYRKILQLPDRRDRLFISSDGENATIYLWQGRVMAVAAAQGTAFAAGLPSALEVQVTRSWTKGVVFVLRPYVEDLETVLEPQDAFFAPLHLLGAPEPEPNDISGNQRYWFRNVADATETACTGANDRTALTVQGAGAMQTVSLTTGQNACWYATDTTGLTIPAGDWETLLDVQTTGDNGGTGDAVGVAAYRSNTGSCATADVNCPKISYWNGGGAWSTEYELPTAGGAVENVRVEWDPLLSYKHWIVVNAGATITVYYCSDLVILAPPCSSLGTATTQAVGTAPERHWDISIEQSSGDGLLVYDNPATNANTLCYRTFTTSLSGETCVDHSWVNTTSPSFEYVQLRSNPGANTIALFAADTTNDDAILWIWDGSAWLTGDDERACTLTYTLTQSYPGVVVAEDSANEYAAYCGDGANNVNVCEWTSAAGWEYDSGATVTCAAFDPDASAGNDVRTFSTGYAYEIGGNRDLLATNNDGNDIDIWAWLGVAGTGGTVGLLQEPVSTDCSAVCRDYDTAFDPQDDDANDGIAVVWDDTADNRCEFRTWDRATDTWSGALTFDTCTGGLTNWFTAVQSPWSTDATAAMILRGNDANDVLAHQWTGGAGGTVDGEQTLTADATDQAYPYFDFAWGPRPVQYDVRIEVWNLLTDTVASTIGTCLDVVARGDDVQCLVSGVAQQVIGATQVVRVYIAHSSAAGTVSIDYDDADSTGDSRLTVPIPEFEQVILFLILPGILLAAVWIRRRKK